MPQRDNNLTDSLIALKAQYEQALVDADTKVSHIREQLSHINALLLNQFVPIAELPSVSIKPAQPVLTLDESSAEVEHLALSPAAIEPPVSKTPKGTASAVKSKAVSVPTPASGKRSPRPLLPIYGGLTRLEAIAQILQSKAGQDVSTDSVSEALFGSLSAAEHKAERKSLNTQLYKGQSLKLWQKGTTPGTFLISGTAPLKTAHTTPTTSKQTNAKVPATKVKSAKISESKRKSLPLLPAYAALSKRDAIAQVLEAASGKVLHHDTIIHTLYGDLSLQELKEERVRIKTALLTGVKDGKWQKAFEPSSYFLKASGAGVKSKSSVRKPKASKPEPVVEVLEAIAKVPAARPTGIKSKPARKPAASKVNAPAKAKTPKKKSTQT